MNEDNEETYIHTHIPSSVALLHTGRYNYAG